MSLFKDPHKVFAVISSDWFINYTISKLIACSDFFLIITIGIAKLNVKV